MNDTAAQEGRTRKPLYGVLIAFALSLTGTRIAAIALPWFVLVTTGSAGLTGLLALCEMAPYVVVKVLGGPIIDAVGPRRISITMDIATTILLGAVPLLWLSDAFTIEVLFVIAGVVGAVRGPGDAAKEVFVPRIADRAGLPLERVTGLSGTIERLASTVGPAVAGGLVAVAGAVTAIAVTAVASALSAVLILVTIGRADSIPAADDESDEARSTYLRRLRDGASFLRADRLLLAITLMVMVTNFLDAAMMAVLLPVWALQSGAGPAAIGLLGSVVGGTALVGSICSTVIAERLPRRSVFTAGFLIGGAPRYVVLAFDLPLPVVALVWGVSGFGLGFLNPIVGAVVFERIPAPLLGRVNTLVGGFAWSLIPVGGLAAAAVLGVSGFAPAVLLGGAAYFAATMVPAVRREWRQMNRTGSVGSDPAMESRRSGHARTARQG